MDRRTALTLIPAALLARRARAQSPRRIGVIGAGLAGLAAARDLRAGGHEVMVIEARTRIGGRIHTSRLWDDPPVDRGASISHGAKGNPISALADQAEAVRAATPGDRNLALGPDGSDIDLTPATDMTETLVATARDAAERGETALSLAKALQSFPAWGKADGETRRLVRHHVNASFAQEYAGDWTEASAWHVDVGKEFDGPDVVFPGGFDQTVAPLAGRFAVRMGQMVTALALVIGDVAVTAGGGPAQPFDHAVMTLPLGVLNSGSISFAEPLAPARPETTGRLAFVGEAASPDFPGTAHGALLPGQAAARTVLEHAG